MGGMVTKVRRSLAIQSPLARGMISYAVVWPSSSIVQEYIEHGTMADVNLARAARFGIFGTFGMAPAFYTWLKISSKYFKKTSFKSAITRAAVEQVCYSPFAVTAFFVGMGLLEMKPLSTSVNELREKFWPTFTTGLMYWPMVQTLNFYFISERNRMIFVSAASFMWTVYLAHVKEQPVAESKPNLSQAEPSLQSSGAL